MDWNKAYYSGKIAAVTGAASGVGLALVELMLEYGADKVTLADFNKASLDSETARLSEIFPGKVTSVLCDVTSKEQVFNMVETAAKFGGGRLDILVNCAGAGLAGKFLFEPDGIIPGNPALSKVLTNEDWKKGFALNFTSAVHGCMAAVPIMAKQGGGQIINIASGIAFAPMAYQSLYAATKAALVAFSYSARSELNAYGILINAATPGTTATGIFKKAGIEAPPDAQMPRVSAENILRGVAENRRLTLGDEADVKGAINSFLPDDMGRHMDRIFCSVAESRRKGQLAFLTKLPPVEPTPLFMQANAIATMIFNGDKPDHITSEIAKYDAMRDSLGLDRSYYAGKTAAVTGGASGVGFALCKKMLECGAKKVVLADINKENLALKEKELNELYPDKAKGICCDVTDEQSVKAMIAQAEEWFPDSFDILINCAGIGQMGRTFDVPEAKKDAPSARLKLETPERWKLLFDVNFAGAMYGCRAVLPVMLRYGSGQIVNIISGVALAPLPYQALYAASKAALNMATLSLRYEFAADGIKICSAAPGIAATSIYEKIGAPEGAQSPETAAIRILTGVARNERVIPGDNGDLLSLFIAHNPGAAALNDQMLNALAASRKSGAMTDFPTGIA